MRVMSDFDGVFTDPAGEAEAVGARQLEVLTEVLGDEAADLVQSVRDEVRRNPMENGWISEGLLSCYADEDPYVFHNAVSAKVFGREGAHVSKLKEAGFDNHDALSMRCFEQGTSRYRDQNETHLLDEAVEALQAMLDEGWNVTIVSNSSTDRVARILSDLGVGHDRVPLRGGAKKFVVTAERHEVDEFGTYGERKVRLRRGHYFDILQDEKPDAVIGDVLSLDLALPAHLRSRDGWAKDMKVHLKRNAYTPAWSLEAAERTGMRIVRTVGEMVDGLRT